MRGDIPCDVGKTQISTLLGVVDLRSIFLCGQCKNWVPVKRVTPSQFFPPGPQAKKRRGPTISLHFPQSGLDTAVVLAGVGCGYGHRKTTMYSTCGNDETVFVFTCSLPRCLSPFSFRNPELIFMAFRVTW